MRKYKYVDERRHKSRHLRPHELRELQQAVSAARGVTTKRAAKWRADTKRWREAIEAR